MGKPARRIFEGERSTERVGSVFFARCLCRLKHRIYPLVLSDGEVCGSMIHVCEDVEGVPKRGCAPFRQPNVRGSKLRIVSAVAMQAGMKATRIGVVVPDATDNAEFVCPTRGYVFSMNTGSQGAKWAFEAIGATIVLDAPAKRAGSRKTDRVKVIASST